MVFLSLVLNFDQVQVPEVPIHCQRLLANIIMKLCPHVNPTQVFHILCKMKEIIKLIISNLHFIIVFDSCDINI